MGESLPSYNRGGADVRMASCLPGLLICGVRNLNQGMSTRERKKLKKKSPGWVKALKIAFILIGCSVCAFVVAAVIILVNATGDAGKLLANLEDKIQEYNSKPTEIYSSDGVLLYSVSPVYRKKLSLSDVPTNVKLAVLAAEDKRFYQHQGVDYFGLLRATLKLASDRKASQGGSTITMQLAKRLYSASEKSLQRKVQDIALAIEMEKRMSKDEILELYLNQVYFGERAYGIAAASEVYFNKKVKDLTAGEAATLARCVRRPSDENPIKDLEKAKENRDVVLANMREDIEIAPGKTAQLSEAEYEKAKSEELVVQTSPVGKSVKLFHAPFFVQEVLRELKDIPLKEGGYRITTTLDWSLQKVAEAEVKATVAANQRRKVTNAAFVMIDSTGRILSEVGGVTFGKRQTNAIRYGDGKQPGSSFKPIVYATAFRKGVLHLGDSLSNERIFLTGRRSDETWSPKNSNGRYGGSLPVRYAFANSVNLPAIHCLELIGADRAAQQGFSTDMRSKLIFGAQEVVKVAKDSFGFTSKIQAVPSLPLGANTVKPIEMAEAYSVFMNAGTRVKPYSVVRVTGPDGAEINLGGLSGPVETPNVLGDDVCNAMDTLLEEVVLHGSGRAASVVPGAHGKTGTTNDNKDAWFCGYTRGLVGIGWVGNEVQDEDHNWVPRPMARDAFGGTVTAGMWAKIMGVAVKKYSASQLTRPKPPKLNPGEQENVPAITVHPPDEDTNEVLPDDLTGLDPAGDHKKDPNAGGTNAPTDPGTPAEKGGATGEKSPDSTKTDPLAKGGTTDAEVTVELCEDSLELASRYCPQTIERKLKKSAVPKKKCHLHQPPPP